MVVLMADRMAGKKGPMKAVWMVEMSAGMMAASLVARSVVS